MSCCARMRDGRLHHRRRRSRRRAQARLRIQPYPGAIESRAGYAKEYLRQLFRDSFGGDHPPDWERADDVRAGTAGDGRAGGRQTGCGGSATPTCRRRWWRSIRRPETCWRWSAAATSGSRSSTAPSRSRRQPGSAFKPLLYAAALSNGFSPVVVLDGLAAIAPQGPEEWSPRNAEGGRAGDADAARGAGRIEQPRRGAAAAAHRIAAGAAARRPTSACATCRTCRRCRSGRAWSRRSI